MRGVILNEYDIFNKAINKGEMSKRPMETLRILAKKYLSDGMDKEQVIETLQDFMKNNYENYKPSKWQKNIEELIKSILKYNSLKLIHINYIDITKNEFDNILKLNNKLLERLAFVMLVYQKINIIKNPNSNGWINNCISDIFREASVGYTGDEQKKLLYGLYENKYILMKNSCDSTSIKLDYIDINSENLIHIDNFENVISYYYEYKYNEKWKVCCDCEKRFKLKTPNSNQIYCQTCAKKIKLENDRKIQKERYISRKRKIL